MVVTRLSFSYGHVRMYSTLCVVSDISMYKHNKRDSVCLCLMHVFYMNRLSFIFTRFQADHTH